MLQTTLPDYFRTIITHQLIHGITFYHRRADQFTHIDIAGSRPWNRQRNLHHNRFRKTACKSKKKSAEQWLTHRAGAADRATVRHFVGDRP